MISTAPSHLFDFLASLAALGPLLAQLALAASALVLLAALGSLTSRRASTRHLVWATTIASLLALPLFTSLVPAGISLALPAGDPTLAAEADHARDAAPTSPADPASSVPALGEAEEGARNRTATENPLSIALHNPSATSASSHSDSSHSDASHSDRVHSTFARPTSDAAEPPAAVTPANARRDLWIGLAVALWLVGSLLSSARLVTGLLRRRRLLRRSFPFEVPIGHAGRQSRLRLSDAVEIPVTWGYFRPVVLLPMGAEEWSAQRLHHVLLHELAHARRGDATWNTVAHLVRALYWPVPPVRWAVSRLVTESELACDDRVVTAGVAPALYAEELLGFARELRGGLPEPVAAMARRSGLSRRVLAVLDDERDRSAPGAITVIAITLLVCGLATPLVASVRIAAPGTRSVQGLAAEELAVAVAASRASSPTPNPTASSTASSTVKPGANPPATTASSHPTASTQPNPNASRSVRANLSRTYDDEDVEVLPGCGPLRSTQVQRRDDHFEYELRSEDCRFEIELDGELVIADDERTVSSIDPGARLDYRESVGGTDRRLIVDSERGSTPRYRYSVEGRNRELDGEGREWLAQRLPFLLRVTGWQAEERVGRILARSGVDGLFDELLLIPSDHVSRLYFVYTLEQANLGPAELERWVVLAGRTIGSDFELAETLSRLEPGALETASIQRSFVEAAGSIGSDFELRRTLTTLLDRSSLEGDVLDALLESARTIGSDFESTELLVALLARYPAGRPVPATFFEVADSIGSDFELRRALSAFLQRDDVARRDREAWADQLGAVLAAGTSIGSDFEAAELLVEVARRYPEERALPAAYFDVAETIGSDHELARSLSTAAERDLGPAELQRLLEVARSIGSDFDLAELLLAVHAAHSLEGVTLRAFDDALATLAGHERRRVEDATR